MAGAAHGRRFGNGVYLAEDLTKSLDYCKVHDAWQDLKPRARVKAESPESLRLLGHQFHEILKSSTREQV